MEDLDPTYRTRNPNGTLTTPHTKQKLCYSLQIGAQINE